MRLPLTFLVLALASVSAISQTTVNFISKWDYAARGGLNTTRLQNAAHGTYNKFDALGSDLSRWSIAAGTSIAYPNSMTVTGLTFSATGTNWLQNTTSTGSSDVDTFQTWFCSYPGEGFEMAVTNVAVCYFVQYKCPKAGDGINLDLAEVDDGTGSFSIHQISPDTSDLTIQSESGDPTVFSTSHTLSYTNYYFIIHIVDSTSHLTKVRAYDTSTTPYTLIFSANSTLPTGFRSLMLTFKSGYIGYATGTVMFSDWFALYNPTYAQIDGIITNTCSSPIASTNSYAWSTNTVGVPGGIPIRSTINTTLSAGSTAAQITSAIAACTSNQVVKLNAGTYTFNGTQIDFASAKGVTLRGAGMQQTVLNFTNMPIGGQSGDCLTTTANTPGSYKSLTGGYTQGSSNLTVSSTSGYFIGGLVHISETDEPGLVFGDSSSTSNLVWMSQITATNATQITIWPPLGYTLQSGLNPTIGLVTPSAMRCGIEDMTIKSTDGTGNSAISLWSSFGCWITNVESFNFTYHMLLKRCVRCEVRHCYTHGTPGNDGQGVYLYQFCSFCRVEDNQGSDMFSAIFTDETCGNVICFNFATNCYQGGFTEQDGSMNGDHLAHPMFNLWEGNVANGFQLDGYHGSSSHITLLRNWFHGLHPTYTGNRKMVDIDRACYFVNIVGNILGWSSWTNSSTVYAMSGEPDYTSQPAMYRFGYPNMGNNSLTSGSPTLGNSYPNTYPDTKCLSTATIQGNWDFKTASVVTTNTLCTTIPTSLVYDSKPSYFAGCPWPPFEPTTPLAVSQTNIPAGALYPYSGIAIASVSFISLGAGTMRVSNGIIRPSQ